MENNDKLESVVLNQLIASQSILHVFPDDVKLGEFVVQALIGIPGIGGGAICLRNGSFVKNILGSEIVAINEFIKNIPEEQDYFSYSLPEKENQHIFSIHTSERSFGYIFLLVKDFRSFETFTPAINNFINMLAMDLESRWQKEQLVNHKLNLEELVEKRTIELEEEINERKFAEKALEQSENHYRALFNESPVPMWEEDFSEVVKFIEALKKRGIKDFRKYFDSKPDELIEVARLVKIIEVNNATIKLHEANSKEELMDGLASIFTEDSYKAFKEEVIAISENRTTYKFDGIVKTLKGGVRDIHLEWLVVPGYEKTMEKVFISTIDISENKRADELLKESEYNLIRAQEISLLGHWKLQMDIMEVEGSKELLKIFGIEGETLTLDDFAKVVHPDDREYDLKHIQNGIENGVPWNIEHRLLLKGNSIKWVNAIGEPIIDKEGKVTSIVGIVQDITERKQAEKALQFEKESAQKYLDIAGVMFVILNEKGEITLINKKGCEILGYSYDEIINKNWFDVCIHEDIREEIVGVYNNLISGKTEPVEYYENTVINKNGELRTIAFHNTLIRDEESRIKGVLSSGEDITERAKAEEELTKHQGHLEELIKERTKELEEKNKKLDDAILVFVGRELTVRKLEERIAELEE